MAEAFDAVRSYISAMGYPSHSAIGNKPSGYPFVTISRQTGAGGHELAQALQQELNNTGDPHLEGWCVFDSESIRRVLENANLRVSLNSLVSEEYHSQIQDMVYQSLTNRPPQELIIHKMFTTIRLLASRGKVILLGRGGACLTADLPLGIHVRLVALRPDRVRRMLEILRTNENGAQKTIIEQDEFRARLVKDYFGQNIDDALLYHCVWNTSLTPVHEIARSIVQLIWKRSLQPALILQG